MYTVKLTFNYDFPLLRQTPQNAGKWKDYQFIIDDRLKECDFWIVYSDQSLKRETVRCNSSNVIFIPGEAFATSPRFSQCFLDQFGAIVTVQRELEHKNIIYLHNANPWYVNKSYDELKNINAVKKTKLISVISSNKAETVGHRKRLEFVKKLKEHFGSRLDVFGRGVNDFNDKWDVLAPYKYSIAIENDFKQDWVTEKLFDCFLAYTFPIYYGCPNLDRYVPRDCFKRIDINDIALSIRTIEQVLAENMYIKKEKAIQKGRNLALDSENLFPFLARLLEDFNPTLKKNNFTLQTNTYTQPLPFTKKVLQKIKKTLVS